MFYEVSIGDIYHGTFYLSMFELRKYMASWHRPKRESLSYTTNMMTSNSFYTLCNAGLRFDYSDSDFIGWRIYPLTPPFNTPWKLPKHSIGLDLVEVVHQVVLITFLEYLAHSITSSCTTVRFWLLVIFDTFDRLYRTSYPSTNSCCNSECSFTIYHSSPNGSLLPGSSGLLVFENDISSFWFCTQKCPFLW